MTGTVIAAAIVGFLAPFVRALIWGVPAGFLSVASVVRSFVGSFLTVFVLGVVAFFALRAAEPALGIGEIHELPTSCRKEVFAALRTSESGTHRAIVVFNFSAVSRRVRIDLAATGITRLRNYLSGAEVSAEPGSGIDVNLAIYGVTLFEVL